MPPFEATPVCVRIDAARHEALSDMALLQGVTKSDILRDALETCLYGAADREPIYARIKFARGTQEALHPERTCAHPISQERKIALLTAQVGEVSRSVLEDESKDELVKELTEVAATAVAWLEYLLGAES